MGSSLRRRIGLVALVLLVAVPVGRTACEVLCLPVVHAATHGEALQAAGGACHEPGDSNAPALTAAPAHGCGDHARSELGAAVWLKTGRFTVDLRPLAWSPSSAADPYVIEPVVAAEPCADERPLLSSFTHAAITSVVLRI